MANTDGFTTVQKKVRQTVNKPEYRRNTVFTGNEENRGNGRFTGSLNKQSYVNRNITRVVVRSTQTRRKSSRTLLLKEVGDMEFKYEGLQNVDKSPQGNVFLVFDTLDNARKAFKDLRINKVNCKYSYYKLFFKSTGLDTSKTYDDLKSVFLSFLNEKVSNVNVLYFKYYKKDGNFTGSGDFVVDRKVDCDVLVSSRTLKMSDTNEVSFYRFRTNRGDQSNHENVVKTDNSEEEIVNE